MPAKPKSGKQHAEKSEKILVLTVDRDDDIGHKTTFNGPIVGRDTMIKAAVELGLSDPEDSDMNAMFQAVRVFDEVKKHNKAEVAALTGNRSVGIDSDKEVAHQLTSVLSRFKADYAILVTDGVEDEHVLPILQSKVPIMSVRRVIVKQAPGLESGYYKIKDFFEDLMSKPVYSSIILGLPAIFITLYLLFGSDGWRFMLAVLAIVLFIKGFKLDKQVTGGFEELMVSFSKRRFAFFCYIVSIAVMGFATVRGYEAAISWFNIGMLDTISAFVSASVFYYFLAWAISWFGRSLTPPKRPWKDTTSMAVFAFAISILLYNAAEFMIKPDLSLFNFIFSVIFGFVLIFIALALDWQGGSK